jgi:NAD(P)-dependent dehydrogenase (short-subunit alcohol dehydrogenase family)
MTGTRQIALVTGATSGIGKAAAIALAAGGFQVIGTGRNTGRLTAPAGVTYLDLDVTSDESVASAVKQVIDRFGHIDVLVNNAGVGSTGAAEEFSITQTQDIFDINVYGVMRTTKAVLPHMRAQGADASSMSPPSAGSSPARSWPSTSRPSTRSRATPNRWTTRSATTASGSCS